MMRREFNFIRHTAEAQRALSWLRTQASTDLSENFSLAELQRADIIGELTSALIDPDRRHCASFLYKPEAALPIARQHEVGQFSEILLRIVARDGKVISPYNDIEAAHKQAFGDNAYTGWLPLFRRKLLIDQLSSGTGHRTSVNVTAQDMNAAALRSAGYPDLPNELETILALRRSAGGGDIILEATEKASGEPWTKNEVETLVGIASRSGAAVAVDDCDQDGQQETLAAFASYLPPEQLLAKISFHAVRDYRLEKNDSLLGHLRSIDDNASGIPVVLEGVENIGNTEKILARLPQDLTPMIAFAQDRSFKTRDRPLMDAWRTRILGKASFGSEPRPS